MTNPIERKIPDFEKITWRCRVCHKERTDKYIKTYMHDLGEVLGVETGMIHVNVKYCVDSPTCKEKASNREWVINSYIPHEERNINFEKAIK